MTDTMTTPESPATEWNTAFHALKTRYPRVREAVLVALHISPRTPASHCSGRSASPRTGTT